MKRLFAFIVLLAVIASCKKDEVKVLLNTDATPPVINNPTASFDKIITAENLGDSVTFAWSATGYGVVTQVNYQVELDSKCGTFANPVILTTVVTTKAGMTLADLNAKLISNLKIAHNVHSDVQVRVTSNISGAQKVISAPITIKVTPYSDKPTALWLGENSASAPVVYATGDDTFESYRWISKGSSFLISNSPTCPTSVFGAGGAGKLAAGETAPPITMPRDGFYKINLNTTALTFDTLYIATWGSIGTATPDAWNSSTPMTYDPGTQHWIDTVTLAAGAIKWRSNNVWDVNYGPAVIADLNGTLITTNDAVDIQASGVYIVTLDFTQSDAPYTYRYTIKETSEFPEPLKVWLPGGYEGFDPSKAPTLYAISPNVYEGYVNIPSSTGIKFTSAPDYAHTNYGYGGTDGVLSNDGAASDINVPAAGYYMLHADLTALTYQIVLVNSWGLIGTATTGQWNDSTPMTFNPADGTWSITTDLANGALKFRANNAWDLNYGPAADQLSGTLIGTDAAISIAEAGNYTITLDLTRSAVPYAYSYTVIKN